MSQSRDEAANAIDVLLRDPYVVQEVSDVKMRHAINKFLRPDLEIASRLENLREYLGELAVDECICVKLSLTSFHHKTTNKATYGYIYFDEARNIKYCCYGPTYKSADGEYRGRFVIYSDLAEKLRKYTETIEIAEQFIIGKFETDWELHLDVFIPNGDKRTRALITKIVNESRLPIKLLTLAIVCDYERPLGNVPEHYKNISEEIDLDGVDISWREYFNGRDANQLGQKLFTLSAGEYARPLDINYPVWRELYLAQLVTMLPTNFITPHVSMMLPWFYVPMDRRLFENSVSIDRFNHSEIALALNKKLRQADELNFHYEEPINDKFAMLAESIHKSLTLNHNHLMLSQYAAVFIIEHLGIAFATALNYIHSGEKMHGADLSPLLTSETILRSFIFQMLYTIHCLNSCLRIVHGDLHLGNFTISNCNPGLNAYVVNRYDAIHYDSDHIGEGKRVSDTYIVDNIGISPFIIDFSRSFIFDEPRIEDEFGPRFAELYSSDQVRRFTALIQQHFPDVEKIELTEATTKKYSIIDAYIFLQNLSVALDLNQNFVPKESLLFVRRLIKECDYTMAKPAEDEWPLVRILRENFADFTKADRVSGPINNVYHTHAGVWDIRTTDKNPYVEAFGDVELTRDDAHVRLNIET